MKDKTRDQLIAENEELRRRVAAQEGVDAELRRSEAKWRSVAENAPLFVAVVGQSGKMEFLNRFRPGFEPENVLGKDFCDFLQPQSHEVARKCLEHVFRTGERASYECIGAGPDGSVANYVADVGPVIVDGQVVAASLISRDITERKRAEAAFQESEERFRKVFEEGPLGVALVGLDAQIQHCNGRFCEMLGYSETEIIALGIQGISHPDDFEKDRQFGSRLLRGEIPRYTIEKRHIRKNGQVFWGQLTASMLHDSGGKPSLVIGMIEDITERRRTEEALRQSQQRLSLHFQQMPLGAIKWDLDFKVTRWNPGAEQILGYSPEEALGRHASFIVPKNAREHVDQVWNDLLVRRGGERSTNENVTKDGRAILCEWYNTPLVDADGNVIGVASLVDDITEKKRAEDRLRASEERLALAASGTRVGMFDWNIVTGETLWNEQHARLLGLTTTTTTTTLSLPYQYNDWAGRVHPDDLPQVETTLRRCMAEHIPYETEYRVVWPDGSVHWLIGRGVYQYDGQDQPQRMLGIVMDITDRKRAEEALRQAHDELEERVKERTAELSREVEERKQAQEALAQSEEKYRLLVETTATGYVILDGQGEIIDANAEYLRISGHRTLEELLGRTVVEWTAPYDVDRNAKEVEKCYRKGFVRQLEIDYVHPDGKIVPVDINATCLDTEDGRRIVCLCRDITERKQAQEALERERQSLWRMLQASDHERQIISYDIHDGLAQYLAAANMQLQVFDHVRDDNPEEARKAFDAAMQLVSQSHLEARRLISGVRPPALDEAGLETAVAHLVHDQRVSNGPKIKFDSDVQFGRLPSILENSLYRIAQEALTNACKHSKSKKVTVTMAQEGQEVRLEVQDWGIGFDPETVAEGHFGLEGIRQRVRLLGGRLTIESTPDSGTLVQVVVPIVEKQNEE